MKKERFKLKNLKKAYVTNTRLMGVVGVVAYYPDFIDIYHIDYEEYGIDNFKRVYSKDVNRQKQVINSIIGGLGGKLKKINKNQCLFILKEGLNISDDFIDLFPELENIKMELSNLNIQLSSKERQSLNNRMCVTFETDIECINYYFMRNVGCDLIYKMFESKPLDFKLTDKPYTLLKNTVEPLNSEHYHVKSLIDFKNKYRLITSDISIEDKTLSDAREIETMDISSTEAAFILNKKEYILIYYVSDDGVEERFFKDHNHLMIKSYEKGCLYSEYNPNNHHVRENPYFLNGDLYGIYYFTTGNQLVVSSFVEENIDEMINRLSKYKGLLLNDEYVVDQSLIYSFITSKFDDFYGFLNIESRV